MGEGVGAELVGRELGDAATAFESDPDLRDFLARPWTPATAKRAVATEVAQRSGLSKLTSDFLALVAERGRADHLEAIAEKYQKLVDEDLGRVRARIRTAIPSSRAESARRCPRSSRRRWGAAGDRVQDHEPSTGVRSTRDIKGA